MKTFLKVVLLFAVVALLIHLWPLAAVPLAIGGVIALIVGAVLASGVAVIGGVLVTLVCALVGVLLTVAVAASPIWLPILAIIGLVALVRRGSRTPA